MTRFADLGMSLGVWLVLFGAGALIGAVDFGLRTPLLTYAGHTIEAFVPVVAVGLLAVTWALLSGGLRRKRARFS